MKLTTLLIYGLVIGGVVLFITNPTVIFLSIGLSIPLSLFINKVWCNKK